MVRRRIVETRAEAKRAIEAGLVRVGALTDPKPATLVAPEDPVHLASPPEPYVSRAGRKLAHALGAFAIPVEGLDAIDVGASTGGFTDCLLQNGARSVCALDVGHGQLHWRIRSDDRVDVIEHANIRTYDLATLTTPFELIVADLSFISLRTVAAQLTALGDERSTWILLIKPQFEVGRANVGKGGIVQDPIARADAIDDVLRVFTEHGLGCRGLTPSPITGAQGNIEYLATFAHGPSTVTRAHIDD